MHSESHEHEVLNIWRVMGIFSELLVRGDSETEFAKRVPNYLNSPYASQHCYIYIKDIYKKGIAP